MIYKRKGIGKTGRGMYKRAEDRGLKVRRSRKAPGRGRPYSWP